MANFNFDKDFDDNLLRASNKTNSSLHPVYDEVRDKTDQIAKRAKDMIQSEARAAEGRANAIKNTPWDSNYGGVGRQGWLAAKAMAFALKSAAAATVPTMQFDGKEIHGRIMINRAGSSSLEFGGTDPVAEMGKGTGRYLVHPAYAFLRRAAR